MVWKGFEEGEGKDGSKNKNRNKVDSNDSPLKSFRKISCFHTARYEPYVVLEWCPASSDTPKISKKINSKHANDNAGALVATDDGGDDNDGDNDDLERYTTSEIPSVFQPNKVRSALDLL